jgi:hypothetical protein
MIHQPTIVIRESAQALLTDRIKAALDLLFVRLEQEARSQAVSLRAIEAYGFTDPEDNSQELVVRETVGLEADQAPDYWDRLSLAIEAWSSTLPSDIMDIINSQIAIEVIWEQGG